VLWKGRSRFAGSLKPSRFVTVEGEAKWLSALSPHNSPASTNGINESIKQEGNDAQKSEIVRESWADQCTEIEFNRAKTRQAGGSFECAQIVVCRT